MSFKMRFNKFVISTSIILMNEHRLCLSAGPDGLAPDSGDGVGAGGPAAAASDAAAPPLEESAAMRPEHWLKKFKSYQCQKILLSDDKLDKLEKGLDLVHRYLKDSYFEGTYLDTLRPLASTFLMKYVLYYRDLLSREMKRLPRGDIWLKFYAGI